MRVIEQARLWFREGTSDKVYDVDLVEVAANQHVVNFRYGRRGSPLRDGTKTATPLPLAKAKAIFDKLVAEKVAGGYQHLVTPGGATATAPGATPAPADTRAAHAALIARLRQGARGDTPLGAAVWRAGDLDLADAEPALLELLDAPPPHKGMEAARWQHTVLSALVRCATTASLTRLEKLAADPRAAPHVRDVARLAIARVAPARGAALAHPLLPTQLAGPLARGDLGALARAGEELLAERPDLARGAAVGLYLIDDPLTRPAVLAIARVARLSNSEAAVVRALFRLAELRRDGELYALLARRIDAYTGSVRPFSPRTRGYFRRRVARMLRRLARAGSPDYVQLASAILLSYTDDDGEAPRHSHLSGDWYDRFARYHALCDVIYGRSPRYGRAHHVRAAWRCVGSYRPGGPAPAAREERSPELWDAAPEALWRLLRAARATPVTEMAIKALRANRPYVDALPDEALAEVLAAGRPLAQQFAFEMVRDRPMSTALARGGLASGLGEAHAWVLHWINNHVAQAIGDPDLVALLVTGRTSVIRDAALALLRGRALADDVARSACARSLAILLGLGATEADNDRAAAAASILLLVFAAPLAELGVSVLRDLIHHPLPALGELAGEVMLRHTHREALPAELIEALLASPHASLRTLGGRLLAQLPPELAKDDPEALVLFALSANAELREATRTLLAEVARRYPDVGRVIADRLIDALLARQPEGAPAHVVALLRAELASCLPAKPAATILKLIGALSPHAREAGGLLLGQLSPDDLGLDAIARLAHHEILAVRHGAWALARGSLDRYRLSPVALSRLVDSPWEDTRAFAIAFIRDEVKQVSADAIIAICDSIRPEVQELGKQLLHDQFQTADAGRYLVRLSEHPSINLQLLVSGMLAHHVEGDLARIAVLAPYLVTVLSQVNRGKVAKERVIALLRREAARSAEAAQQIAPILERQSATIAISQKHPLIATMVEVHDAFPEIALPITVTPAAPHDDAKGGR